MAADIIELPPGAWERHVRCFCGQRLVVTRTGPETDHLAVCSVECWQGMRAWFPLGVSA